ncbi:DNA adenine methylase [Pseudomethylobacillus aquaticus]|uniref:site-specific DNA-methyltransferase (adenine-specific) n=1 Tax=Pseudomethylobacillus aquaticus TaxID=2676064 RepID=A0A3N0V0M9_9PROT|nr:DNA adenine methylase [Pseudomethylobacillus aquaticus]ROH86104.1 DNA adenine methylase [Pseudomethylobacillus aquaticus]
MPVTHSPLRYPGGKTQLFPLLRDIIIENDLRKCVYAEPFAGGSGLGLELLFSGWAAELWINDLDPAIYAFWNSVLNQPEDLCKLIDSTGINLKEWQSQRNILSNPDAYDPLQLGFATLYLNRTNRSGILKGGVIGGLSQAGNYKLDCRFNKADICRKIRRIAIHKSVIKLSNLDASECLSYWDSVLPERSLINIDPPYYEQGQALYLNHFQPEDHTSLSTVILSLGQRWMLTYDDVPSIEELYKGHPTYRNSLLYSAQVKRKANELVVFSTKLRVPVDAPNCNLEQAV